MRAIRIAVCIFAVFLGVTYGLEAEPDSDTKLKAMCNVVTTTGTTGSPPIEGTIIIEQEGDEDTTIKVSLQGFPTSMTSSEDIKYGFHIHDKGNMADGCSAAEGHYNPFGNTHGAPSDEERHVGDLGNLVAKNGKASFTITDSLVKLNGENNVIGRSFVIHALEDDLGTGGHDDSQTTGHAGARIGCCIIEEMKTMAVCKVDKTTGKAGTDPVEGTITLEQGSGLTKIVVSLMGFNPSATKKIHGFHIHEKANMGDGCVLAGGHYNPYDKEHGAPADSNRHVGDLGNIEVDDDGKVSLTIEDTMVMLHGSTNVMGKSFVIHADEDDLGRGGYPDSKTTGHAGSRVACCIIEEQQLFEEISSSSIISPSMFLLFSILTALTF